MEVNDSCGGNEVVSTQADQLRSRVEAILVGADIPSVDAALVAETLVEADLCGMESHGVTRLSGYVDMLSRGLINPTPKIQVVRDTGSCATIDGDLGFGMLVARTCMDLAIQRAAAYGVAMVTARNMTHTGMVGFYTVRAARKGMIGIAMNSGPALVPAYGARTPLVATNPISVAVPSGDREPVVLDMATTTAASGKFRLAVKQGLPIPSEWGLDRDGLPTNDPSEVLKNGFFQWAGGYKGYGLAIIVEILSAVLSGGSFGRDTPTMRNFGVDPLVSSGTYIAIDVARFMALEEFCGRVDQLVAQVHSSELAPGVAQVYVPGDPEHATKRERLANGIPISKPVHDELLRLAQK